MFAHNIVATKRSLSVLFSQSVGVFGESGGGTYLPATHMWWLAICLVTLQVSSTLPPLVIFHPLRRNLLRRISESEPGGKISAVNVGVSCLPTAVNGSSRLKALASCHGPRHNFFLGKGLAPSPCWSKIVFLSRLGPAGLVYIAWIRFLWVKFVWQASFWKIMKCLYFCIYLDYLDKKE